MAAAGSAEPRDRPDAVRSPAVLRAGQALIALAAVTAVVVWAVIAVSRLRYAYELDHTESGLVEHVRRLREARSIYGPPSIDFVPFPYPPLYVGAATVVSYVFGASYFSLRLVSVVSTCGVLWMLFRIVARQTESRWAGLACAGIFAASYRLAGTWFDVAKPDMLFLFLTLAALDVAARSHTWRSGMAAGAIMAGAILTKQTALIIAVPVVCFLLLTRRSIGLAFSAALVGAVGAATLLLDVLTDGWFRYYVWQELPGHATLDLTPWQFVRENLLAFWPSAVAAALAGRRWVDRERRWFVGLYAAAIAGMFAGSYAALRHIGGYDNVLLPAAVGMALLAGLAVGWTIRSPRLHIALVALSLCLFQFLTLRYDPAEQIPSTADVAAGNSLIAWLGSVKGDVLVTTHPTYAVLAGHRSHAASAGTFDVVRSNRETPRRLVLASYADAIHCRRFAAIVLDDDVEASLFPPDWKDFYVKSDVALEPPPRVFFGVASGSVRPTQVWIAKPRPGTAPRPSDTCQSQSDAGFPPRSLPR